MLRADCIRKVFTASGQVITALDDITIELHPGERLGLLGRSGSGKSTLAQVLALVLRPDQGDVTLDGQRLRRWGVQAPAELRRRVQLIWQSPRQAVDPRLRLQDIVLEPLAAARSLPFATDERASILREMQARVGLTDELLHRFPHEVSDGQLQRACLARALVLQPEYLICDEMSSMLDVSTQAALLQAIADEQAARNVGVLLITHDRILAEHWCDRILEIGAGRLAWRTAAPASGFKASATLDRHTSS